MGVDLNLVKKWEEICGRWRFHEANSDTTVPGQGTDWKLTREMVTDSPMAKAAGSRTVSSDNETPAVAPKLTEREHRVDSNEAKP